MGKMSLNKGQNFERQIAKLFSEWSGIPLVRTPMSGAWEGCEVDIWPENPEVYWPLAIECKKAESWNMDQVMEGTGPVYDWLEQAEQQAKEWSDRTGKTRIPMLVFSRNRHPTYVAITVLLFSNPVLKTVPATSVYVMGAGKSFYISKLTDFFYRFSMGTIFRLLDINLSESKNAFQREDGRSTL